MFLVKLINFFVYLDGDQINKKKINEVKMKSKSPKDRNESSSRI